MVMLTLAAGGLSLVPKVSAELSGTVRLTKSMKARLSHKIPRHGYAHGEKMSTLKAMRVGSTMGKKTVRLVEMSGIIFTPIDTKPDMLKDLNTKNMDILICAFPCHDQVQRERNMHITQNSTTNGIQTMSRCLC